MIKFLLKLKLTLISNVENTLKKNHLKKIILARKIFMIIKIVVVDESSDSAIHTVYKRIKGMKGYKMT